MPDLAPVLAGPSRALAGAADDPLPTEVSWDLLRWCPDATAAVFDGAPSLVVRHFQLAGG